MVTAAGRYAELHGELVAVTGEGNNAQLTLKAPRSGTSRDNMAATGHDTIQIDVAGPIAAAILTPGLNATGALVMIEKTEIDGAGRRAVRPGADIHVIIDNHHTAGFSGQHRLPTSRPG